MADFYAALRRQNGAAPLADFATALNNDERDQLRADVSDSKGPDLDVLLHPQLADGYRHRSHEAIRERSSEIRTGHKCVLSQHQCRQKTIDWGGVTMILGMTRNRSEAQEVPPAATPAMMVETVCNALRTTSGRFHISTSRIERLGMNWNGPVG